MFLGLLRTVLGPFAVILDWAEANPVPTGLMMFAWTAVWMSGRVQLARIERKTRELIASEAHRLREASPELDAEELLSRIYPLWCTQLPTWALFIPHRLELWPVPVSIERVKDRIGLSAQLVRDVLEDVTAEHRTDGSPS